MRSDLTLIKLVKKEFEGDNYSGFCSAINRLLYFEEKIDSGERLRIWRMLLPFKPKKYYQIGPTYWFKPYSKAPRLKILNKTIKELERQ